MIYTTVEYKKATKVSTFCAFECLHTSPSTTATGTESWIHLCIHILEKSSKIKEKPAPVLAGSNWCLSLQPGDQLAWTDSLFCNKKSNLTDDTLSKLRLGKTALLPSLYPVLWPSTHRAHILKRKLNWEGIKKVTVKFPSLSCTERAPELQKTRGKMTTIGEAGSNLALWFPPPFPRRQHSCVAATSLHTNSLLQREN